MDNTANYSAFLAYRSKPQPTTFSSKALNFHASEYRTQQQPPILIENDAIEKGHYTQFDQKLDNGKAEPGQFEETFDNELANKNSKKLLQTASFAGKGLAASMMEET